MIVELQHYSEAWWASPGSPTQAVNPHFPESVDSHFLSLWTWLAIEELILFQVQYRLALLEWVYCAQKVEFCKPSF